MKQEQIFVAKYNVIGLKTNIKVGQENSKKDWLTLLPPPIKLKFNEWFEPKQQTEIEQIIEANIIHEQTR